MQDRRWLGAVVLAAAITALPAGDTWAQGGKKKPTPSDKLDSAKFTTGKYAGVLKSAPNSDRIFDVEVALPGGKKVVEFQLTEKAKVRTHILPDAFDDKGERRKFTRKELDELRGKDRSLPGYECAVEGLASGQTVQLTLVSVPKPAAGKKKDEDGLKEFVTKSKQVRLVVITQVPEGSDSGRPIVPKKK